MEFCQERGLHLICDEVFGLLELQGGSGGDEKAAPEFMSALSLTEALVPSGAMKIDASRVHVVWSPSKLFGLSGFRVVCLFPIIPPPSSSSLYHLSILSKKLSMTSSFFLFPFS